MKKYLVWIVMIGSLTHFNTSNAAWFVGTINRIQFGVTNNLIVYIDAAGNHECGSQVLQFVDPNSTALKYVYASLLSWEAQQKRIQFAITGCAGTAGVFSYVEDLKQ